MQIQRIAAVALVMAAASPALTSTSYCAWASEQQPQESSRLIRVRYRPTLVDVGDRRFAHLDTSRSSLVTDAWYDESHAYMVVGLKDVYYHYCRMPIDAWDAFGSAGSFGQHYNRLIKGRYDCRVGGVPEY